MFSVCAMNLSILLALAVLCTVIENLLASPLVNNDAEVAADKRSQLIAEQRMRIAHDDDECPPGIWTCKKKRSSVPKPQIAHDDNECPPGIWTCSKKKRDYVPVPMPKIKNEPECPMGIWACKKKKRGVEFAKKRLDMLRRWIREKAEKEARQLMNAAAKKQQKKRGNLGDCPLGVWVC